MQRWTGDYYPHHRGVSERSQQNSERLRGHDPGCDREDAGRLYALGTVEVLLSRPVGCAEKGLNRLGEIGEMSLERRVDRIKPVRYPDKVFHIL